MRKYHVITVHFGSPTPTKTLIEQLYAGPEKPDSITVVDHAQQTLTLAPRPGLSVIRQEKNSGYAAGINLGLGLLTGQGASRQDIVLALNNDVEVAPESLRQLKGWWDQNPQTKLAGLTLGHVNLLTGRATLTKSSYSLLTTTYKLSYLDGACLIAPLETFLALQGLPSEGFLYWEDVIFSSRAKQLGFPLAVVPNLGIHHPPKSTPPTGDQLYYLVRNGAHFLSQLSPRPWRYLWKALNPLRRLYHALRPLTPDSPIVREALRDAAHGKFGPRV